MESYANKTWTYKRRRTMCFKVSFYWLIGKLSMSSFIPAPNFWKIRKIRWVKNYLNLTTRCYYDKISGCPWQILSGRRKKQGLFYTNCDAPIKQIFVYIYLFNQACCSITLSTDPSDCIFLVLIALSNFLLISDCILILPLFLPKKTYCRLLCGGGWW